jgi:hypothetical protein
MLHFKKTSADSTFADIRERLGLKRFPATEKTLSTGEPEATTHKTFKYSSNSKGYVRLYLYQNASGSRISVQDK